MSRRVAIVGSREFPRLDWVRWYVDHELEMGDLLVSGGARGVDHEAAHRARWRGLDVQEIPAQWQRPDGSTNRGAGYARNLDIVKDADLVVAFWDGKSHGTRNSIEWARDLLIDLTIITPDSVEAWRYRDEPWGPSNPADPAHAPLFTKRILASHTKRPTRQASRGYQPTNL